MRRAVFLVFGLAGVLCAGGGGAQALTVMDTPRAEVTLQLYQRTDAVTFENTVDLDHRNTDDRSASIGFDYSLGLGYTHKDDGLRAYLKIERNGPFDYSAPLWVSNALLTSGGRIEAYRDDELLPQLEELWVDVPWRDRFRVQAGLTSYVVGLGMSLNGSYENIGVKLYREAEPFSWHLYYCRPDAHLKNHLGARIRQDEEQGIDYHPGAINFWAADLSWRRERLWLQPYCGVLSDYTAAGKRDSLWGAPVKHDILGTAGFALTYEAAPFAFKAECARNFGVAQSGDPSFKDIQHQGYLVYGRVAYGKERVVPFGEFLVCSGNAVTEEEVLAQDATLSRGKNRAFSVFSSLNQAQGDSIGQESCDAKPLVAMGSGWGLNYGVPRPGTFGASDYDNLLMPSLGCEVSLTDAVLVTVQGYYLRCFARGVGMWEGEPRALSAELGYEVDVTLDYQMNERALVSLLAGYFIPGNFYRERRDDVDGSLLTPFVRGDAKADAAYQVELSLEWTF